MIQNGSEQDPSTVAGQHSTERDRANTKTSLSPNRWDPLSLFLASILAIVSLGGVYVQIDGAMQVRQAVEAILRVSEHIASINLASIRQEGTAGAPDQSVPTALQENEIRVLVASAISAAESALKDFQTLKDSISSRAVPPGIWQSLAVGVFSAIVLALIFRRFESIDRQVIDIGDSIRDDVKERFDTYDRYYEGIFQRWYDQRAERLSEEIGNLEKEISIQRADIDKFSSQYKWLLDAVREHPETVTVNSVEQAHRLATISANDDKPALATAALKQIVEMKLEGGEDDFHNSAVQARKLGHVSLALSIIERGLQLMPWAVDLLATRASILSSLGRLEEAERLFETLASSEEKVRLYWRITSFHSDHLKRMSRFPEAIEVLKRRLALVPHCEHTFPSLAIALEEYGEIANGIEVLKDDLRWRPGATGAWYNLARLEDIIGNLDAAYDAAKVAAATASELQPSMTLERILGLLASICEKKAIRAEGDEKAVWEEKVQHYYLSIMRLPVGDPSVRARAIERLLYLDVSIPQLEREESRQLADSIARSMAELAGEGRGMRSESQKED